MKGITPVIAIILLLLITISMVGFAFVWFTRVSELATQQTEEQLKKQLETQSMNIRIDSVTKASPMNVVIRNTGSTAIPYKSIVGFKNSVNIDCADGSTKFSASSATLAVDAIVTCKDGRATPEGCTTGDKIKITTPGKGDEVLCPA
ncbi:MAG: hypothetical protein HYT72_00990 [Candidatus Aenigmarchaeota archaeon]|nr:hypothetical protein [Candidatus Aenigmarchaeota archaeon]